MGLDMYLSARKYVSGYEFDKAPEQQAYADVLTASGLTKKDIEFGNPSAYILVSVGYWRKVNSVHNWFVKHVQDGVDECQKAYVSREQLAELLQACETVIADATKAEELLPPQAGFFFGSTDLDEYYYQDLKRTAKMLKRILTSDRLKDFDFEYQSSW
jgi:outer membrane protein OmpA-like peptidoglycan-associated protein